MVNDVDCKWIISYLETYKLGNKQDFIILLSDKLPDALDEKQKDSKVRNILKKMKKEGIIDTDSDNKSLGNLVLVK
jgi:ATP-dependent DNA helicase RecG